MSDLQTEAERIVNQWLEENWLRACDPPWHGPDDAPSYLETKHLYPLEKLIATAFLRVQQAQRSKDAKIAEDATTTHQLTALQMTTCFEIAAAIRREEEEKD